MFLPAIRTVANVASVTQFPKSHYYPQLEVNDYGYPFCTFTVSGPSRINKSDGSPQNKRVKCSIHIRVTHQREISAEMIYLFDSCRYIYTDLQLQYLLHSPNETCDYFLITNGDNLYGHDFFHHVVPEMRQHYDLIAVEFVSRYCFPKGSQQTARPGMCACYVVFNYCSAFCCALRYT